MTSTARERAEGVELHIFCCTFLHLHICLQKKIKRQKQGEENTTNVFFFAAGGRIKMNQICNAKKHALLVPNITFVVVSFDIKLS